MLLEVGRIDKAHGLKGEVIVRLVTNRTERIDPGSVLDSDRGPLTVRSSVPHLGRFIVAFDGVSDRTSADRLRGVVLRAESMDDPDELWVHDLIGSILIDQHGRAHGPVVAVRDNPASDLLELADGQLVPLVFVVDSVPGETITVDVPSGLLTASDEPPGPDGSGEPAGP